MPEVFTADVDTWGGEPSQGNFVVRAYNWVAERMGFAKVTPLLPGQKGDGLVRYVTAGTPLDRNWVDLEQSIRDARGLWEKNPMARRMIGLITSHVVGSGINVSSEKASFNKFIEEFWNHPENRMDMRLSEWCDELSKSGEIFPVLFTDPEDGMSVVRLVPAVLIEDIEVDDEDYERELRYKERTDPGADDKWWVSPKHPSAHEARADGTLQPWMMHFAVNRSVGAVRGQSDLDPVIKWLNRYERWLDDRVSLNKAMRSFYWIVYAARHLRQRLADQYSSPPREGSLIVAEEGGERWEAVTPNLNARDAKEDGRAIRWMVASGGPGTALSDFGEGEESGLSKGKDTNEQRRRFMLRRQRYFTNMLAELVVTAYNRHLGVGEKRFAAADIGDVIIKAPDVSVEDNQALAAASSGFMDSAQKLRGMIGDTEDLRRLVLRLYIKLVGESLTDKEFEALMQGDPVADMEKFAPPMAGPQGNQQGGQSNGPKGQKKDEKKDKKNATD